MPQQDLALFDGAGQYDVGAVLQPPSEGIWGIPREKLEQLTGFGLDVSKNHEEARTLMRSLGLWAGRRVESQRVGAQHRMVSRSGGHPEGSAEGNLDRWRARKR
jgi:hypothetical protein